MKCAWTVAAPLQINLDELALCSGMSSWKSSSALLLATSTLPILLVCCARTWTNISPSCCHYLAMEIDIFQWNIITPRCWHYLAMDMDMDIFQWNIITSSCLHHLDNGHGPAPPSSMYPLHIIALGSFPLLSDPNIIISASLRWEHIILLLVLHIVPHIDQCYYPRIFALAHTVTRREYVPTPANGDKNVFLNALRNLCFKISCFEREHFEVPVLSQCLLRQLPC